MKVGVIGYANDFGGSVTGSRKGPDALRSLGLIKALKALELDVTDYGNIYRTPEAPYTAPTFSKSELTCNVHQDVHRSCTALSEKVKQILTENHFPFIVGGDHSLSIGSVAAIANHYAAQNKKLGLIWIDTHPDFNTPETSASHNLYGMSVAFLTGLVPGAFSRMQSNPPAIALENLAFIGLRDVDPGERKMIREKNIYAGTMRDIDERGASKVTQEAIEVALKGTDGFIVSFDLDVCDPNFAPGTGTPKRGGLTYRETHLILEALAETKQMVGFEFVEFNPDLDRSGESGEVALSLLESAFGKTIL